EDTRVATRGYLLAVVAAAERVEASQIVAPIGREILCFPWIFAQIEEKKAVVLALAPQHPKLERPVDDGGPAIGERQYRRPLEPGRLLERGSQGDALHVVAAGAGVIEQGRGDVEHAHRARVVTPGRGRRRLDEERHPDHLVVD